ncbi:MAG: 34-kDa subunit of RNA polymerase III (C), partial [Bogoriella megaspora]
MAEAILEKASSPASSPKDKLYAILSEKGTSHTFSQKDLVETGVEDDLQDLMKIVQDLVDAQLLAILQHDGETLYKIRTREQAARVLNLTEDESLIYGHIDERQERGYWYFLLQKQSNLHKTVLDKVIKSLESKRLIKSVRNANNPTRKTYMLAELAPSEEMTGNSWYTEAELDDDFIAIVGEFVLKYIRSRSWGQVGGAIGKRKREEADEQMNGEGKPLESDGKPLEKPAKQRRADKQVPVKPAVSRKKGAQHIKSRTKNGEMASKTNPSITAAAADQPNPPLWQNWPTYPPDDLLPVTSTNPSPNNTSRPTDPLNQYPTIPEIISHIRSTQIAPSVSFTEPEISDLLTMLIHDGKLEKVDEDRYRSIRGAVTILERDKQRKAQGREDYAEWLKREGARKEREMKRQNGGKMPDLEDLMRGGSGWRKSRKGEIGGESSAEEEGEGRKTTGKKKGGRGRKGQEVKAEEKEVVREPEVKVEDEEELEPEYRGLTNGFAEAPCGRCPVFDICGEGSDINAATCLYFNRWLRGGMDGYET